jgi:hypothetical protein
MDARVDLVGSDQGLSAMLNTALGNITSFTNRSTSTLTGVTGAVSNMHASFVALGAFLAGAAFLKSAITDTVKMTEAAMDMGRALGMSTNNAGAVQMALKDIGAEQGEYESTAKGMVKQLATNEEKMNDMGLATRDAAGHLRPLNTLVLEGIQVLGGYKEGTDRALASKELFGKGLDASSKLLLYNQEVVDSSTATMRELGLEVGENSVRAWKAFDDATDRAGFSVDGYKKAIGDSLLPVLTTLVNMFNYVMPAAIFITRNGLSGLTAGFLFVKNGVVVLWETLNAFLFSVIEPLAGFAEAIYKAITGDWSGAVTRFNSIGKNISGVWAGAMDNMVASSRQTMEQVTALFSADTKVGSGGGMTDGKKRMPKEAAKADKASPEKETNRMAMWEAELSERKLKLSEQAQAEGTFREMSKAEELKYWQDIKALRDLNEKESLTVRKKVSEQGLELRKQEFDSLLEGYKLQKEAAEKDGLTRILIAETVYTEVANRYGQESKAAKTAMADILQERRAHDDQVRQIDQLRSDAVLQKRLADIEGQRVDAALRVELGLAERASLIAQETQFEEQRFALQAQALEQRKALIDPQRDPLAYEQMLLQIQNLEQAHEARLRELRGQTALESSATLRTISDTLVAGLGKGTETLLTNWRNVGASLKQVFQGIGKSIIEETILKPLKAKAAAYIKERLMVLAGIGGDAVKAGSGAAASQASIPYVGPILAVAAMAAMLATVGGLASSVPTASASRGFDIPAFSNPITQLHAQEMVLPAHIANPLRNMLAGGQDAPAAPQAQAAGQIRGMPPGDWLMVYRSDLVKALSSANRDFAFTSGR